MPNATPLPPLILLHGALGDATQLAPLATRLAETRAVVTLELEGHGTTPLRGRPLRMEWLAETVIDEISRRRLDQVDLFGYSMGGYVALCIAATEPSRVRRIATLATKLAWTREIAARETQMLYPATIRAKVPKFAAALEARHSAAGWETLLAHTAEMMHDLGERPRLTDDVLAVITQPVRIAVGDRDATVSIDESAAAVRRLPNGELEVHPRTTHPFEKAPVDRIVASLSVFLA